jgi:hypothetical protein
MSLNRGKHSLQLNPGRRPPSSCITVYGPILDIESNKTSLLGRDNAIATWPPCAPQGLSYSVLQ